MKQAPLSETVMVQKCHSRRTKGQVEIGCIVSNQSDRPVFVVNGVRRIHLDESTGTLQVWFSDHGRMAETNPKVRREYSIPETKAIEPGQETPLTARLPENMTRLVVHDDGTFEMEPLDLTLANRVEIHVAINDKPIYFRAKQKDFFEQLEQWGTTVTATVELRTPPVNDKSVQ